MKLGRTTLTSLAFTLVPTTLMAHTGVGDTSGFAHGFMHPLGGLDHLLAMVLVGVFAYQVGRPALWLVPLAFVGVMTLGALLGVAGIPLPYVEIGIALSVIVLGAIVALGVDTPVAVAMAIVALFAVFHGHAHGSEMPMDVSGVTYGVGFALATALLHLAGIGLGALIGMVGESYGKNVYRVAGGLASITGLFLLFG